MTKRVIILILVFSKQLVISQTTILHCLQLKDSLLGKHIYGEISPTKTFIDIKNGYFETFNLETDKKGKESIHVILFQATIFNNADTTIILATTAYKSDEQCDWHETNFYEISKNRDGIKKINAKSILPETPWENILVTVKAKTIIKKYLPQIKKQYLDSTATLNTAINEIYNTHLLLPKKGADIKMTLTTCDYIPRNIGIITPKDWEIITGNLQSVKLRYNKNQKKFTLFNSKK
ncbi:MAG: hypothetical protein JNJ41_14950 [Bacteroidia bacterium]|nr:hypothetical protein [Bacteroidia bacterium]